MPDQLDVELWIVRHGVTAWSRVGRHTSHTDLALEPEGEEQARALEVRLDPGDFDLVLSSPLLRARQTAELAGFPHPEIDPNLTEWDYGAYEGKTTEEIRQQVPGWTIFDSPTPGGETPVQVAARADAVIARAVSGRTLVFTHGHFGRVLTVRWLGMGPRAGRSFVLETATINVLGYERERRVLLALNS